MEKRSITPTRSKAVHGSYLSLTASNVTKAGNAQYSDHCNMESEDYNAIIWRCLH